MDTADDSDPTPRLTPLCGLVPPSLSLCVYVRSTDGMDTEEKMWRVPLLTLLTPGVSYGR